MKELRESVKMLVDKEYEQSSEKFGETYHSSHEALGVLWEEVDEAKYEMACISTHYDLFGTSVRNDDYDEQSANLNHICNTAINGACELIQVANVAQKAIKSMRERGRVVKIGGAK